MFDILPIEILELVYLKLSFINKIFFYSTNKYIHNSLFYIFKKDIEKLNLEYCDTNTFNIFYIDIFFNPDLYKIDDKNFIYFIANKNYINFDNSFIMKNLEYFIKYNRIDILNNIIPNIDHNINDIFIYISKYNRHEMLHLINDISNISDIFYDILNRTNDVKIMKFLLTIYKEDIDKVSDIYSKFIKLGRINEIYDPNISFYYHKIIESFLIFFLNNRSNVNNYKNYFKYVLQDVNFTNKYAIKNKHLYNIYNNFTLFYYSIGYLSIMIGEEILKFIINKGYILDKYFMINFFNSIDDIYLINKYGKIIFTNISKYKFISYIKKYKISIEYDNIDSTTSEEDNSDE